MVKSLPLLSITLALAVSALLLIVKVGQIGSRSAELPPGPPTLPVLGNLHLMSPKDPHLQFQKWAKEYGPIYSLILGTKTFIVLSSETVVKELLDKKGSIYSDRPDMFIGQKIASGGLRLVLMKYGEEWRMIHRMVHNILNVKAAITYIPYQDLENKILLTNLLDTPKDLLYHLRRFTYSLSTQMIFGYRCIDNKDPNLLQLFESFEKWGQLAGSASAQLLDLYPIMQKFPELIAPNVRYAKRLHQIEKKNYLYHWMKAKKALDTGTGLPCFCNDIYRAQMVKGFSDDAAAYISGSLLEAGSDTTAATLYGYILALLVWPDVQRRVQEEVDHVVGPGRLPTMDDYDDLPFVRCCIKESLRWMPTVPLGAPHSVMKDDVYQGYTIPKGASVINNVWAIHMDPERHSNPRVFNPDRYKDDHTTLYQSAVGDTIKRDNFVFGAGRRLCQGIHIAERSLFLGISRLAWGFDFSPAKYSQGNPVQYDIEDLIGGISIMPAEYPVMITPRSEAKSTAMRQEAADCEKVLDPETKQWKEVPEGMAFSTWMPEKAEE